MAEQTNKKQKVIIIGAGPVGALAALYAAKRGDDVEVYELRGDLRDPSTTPLNFTKSINLALSERGVKAMRDSGCPGLIEDVLGETIPMYGRMIHARSKLGELYEESQQYDVHGRAIQAVDRAGLNKRLLDALETFPNVTLKFNHKLTGADFKKNLAWLEDHTVSPTFDPSNPMHRFPEIEVPFDLMIGADGAHSAARYHLMKFARLNYSQTYIDTLWCEFHIPAREHPPSESFESKFLISPHHLHIWPGGSFMFIAIPSSDGSFTCTLFAPSATFQQLSSAQDRNKSLLSFFEAHVPGLVPDLISPDALLEQFTTNPHLPLISLECTPYHHGSSIVILGDAAHAMVPFYGQGMNAGMEDVRVLFTFLDSHGVYTSPTSIQSVDRTEARARALATYTKNRTPDAHAISSLALSNYYEMRSAVTSPLYLLRKSTEELLCKYLPSWGWATQYTRVSFENERYSEVQKSVKRQGNWLVGFLLGTSGLGAVAVGAGIWARRTRGRI